ncbi:MAG: MurR/RpiR family transcriptional regulator [Erysipelotrichaceae bacterium]
MSITFKIKEGWDHFTDVEQSIGRYILDNPKLIIGQSVHSLAQTISVSPASITRFAKKIGYKGFPELKIDLALDTRQVVEDYSEAIMQKDDLVTMCQKAKHYSMQSIEQTFGLLNMHNLEQAIATLCNCYNIYVFGFGTSGLIAQDLQQKLSRLGRNVIYFPDHQIQIAAAAHLSSDDVAIAISYSGETRPINEIIRYAKEQGATTIAITQYSNNTLSRLVDYPLYVPVSEKEIRIGAIQSRDASFYISDLLYVGIAHESMDRTKESLIKTRNFLTKVNRQSDK